MKRQYFSGYSITELRQYAKQYSIAGRTAMTGDELLAAVQGVWNSRRVTLERAVLRGGPIAAGTVLRFSGHPGCTIIATSEVLTHPEYGSLYVTADYTGLCERCAKNHPAGVDHLNRAARGEDWSGERTQAPYRFYLYTLEHVPTPEPELLRVLHVVPASELIGWTGYRFGNSHGRFIDRVERCIGAIRVAFTDGQDLWIDPPNEVRVYGTAIIPVPSDARYVRDRGKTYRVGIEAGARTHLTEVQPRHSDYAAARAALGDAEYVAHESNDGGQQ